MNLGDRLHVIEDPDRVGVNGRETGSGVGFLPTRGAGA